MDRFKLMETFVTVVKLGSYSRAAKELSVTPALISRRILDLEAEFGVKLFNRNTHLLSVTSAGTEYYDGCTVIMGQLRELETALLEKQGGAKGDLKILSSKTFGERILAEVISDFSLTHKNIAVNIVLRDMAPHSMDLITEGFDLAVRTRPYAVLTDTSLMMRKITDLSRILVASPAYLEVYGTPKSPEDLARFNCLNPNGMVEEKWNLSGRSGETAVRISGAPRANSSVVIRTACVKGLGIAMLSRYTIQEQLKDGTLVQVLRNYRIAERGLYVFYEKNRYLPTRTRLFIDYLAKWMKTKYGHGHSLR